MYFCSASLLQEMSEVHWHWGPAQLVRHSGIVDQNTLLAGTPGSVSDVRRAANAALESDESDTLATNDSKVVLDAPLWRHWPGALFFGLTSSVLCGCSAQPACLPVHSPSLHQCLPVHPACWECILGLERASLPASLLIIQLDTVLVGRSTRGVCSFRWCPEVEQVLGPT